MNKARKNIIANIIIGVCIIGVLACVSSMGFDVGVLIGKEQKTHELTVKQKARDEWLQINTAPMFFSFWVNNREFCELVGVESYKDFIAYYDSRVSINIANLYQQYKQEQFLKSIEREDE